MGPDDHPNWRNLDLQESSRDSSATQVLLLEGNPLFAEFTARRLSTSGLSLLGPFARPLLAIAALEDVCPAAALVDADLQDEPGHDRLLAELRERGVRTVLTTSGPLDEARARLPRWPVIAKPFLGRHVHDMVRRVLTG